jgi:hypothetical protein
MTAHETCFALLVYLRCRQAGHVLPNEVKFAGFYRVVLGRACLLAGDLKRAIATLREWQNLDPEPVEPVLLATALYDNSQQEEAKILLREAVDAKPTFTISKWARKQTFSSPDDLAHMVAVLEELGVPK